MIKPLNINVDNSFRLYREKIPPRTMIDGKRTTEWTTVRGKLDRVYLRTCAVYKLLKAERIDWHRAEELLYEEARSVINIWRRQHNKNKEW